MVCSPVLSVGWVDPRVGLGWVGNENIYSPHMVAKYNKNINGTIQKKRNDTMAMHCQY